MHTLASRAAVPVAIFLLSFVLSVGWTGMANAQLASSEAEELYALVPLASDLESAAAVIARFDLNDDDALDAEEMTRLPWKDEALNYDLSKNGRLTMLEATVYFADRRRRYEVTLDDERAASANMSRYDTNRNHVLDAFEVREAAWPEDPIAADLDKDGLLTPFELAALQSIERRRRLDLGVTGIDHMQALRFVKRHDANGDGAIDAAEFEEATSSKIPASFDRDRDRMLSVAEIEIGFAARREQEGTTREDQRVAYGLMRRYDRNRDDTIDADEIERGGWPKQPELFDLDKNGALELAEIAARLAKERRASGITNEHQLAAVRLLEQLDANNSGYVEVDELNAAELARIGGVARRLNDAWIDFDVNSDGKLGTRELAAFLAAQNRKR